MISIQPAIAGEYEDATIAVGWGEVAGYENIIVPVSIMGAIDLSAFSFEIIVDTNNVNVVDMTWNKRC